MKYTSRAVWIIYIGLTALEVMLLYGVGSLPFFDSLTHAFGTMATGGFSPEDASVGAYNSLTINIIITCFMFIAGVNFALYYGLFWHRSPKALLGNTEFRWYAIIFFGAACLIAFDLVVNSTYSLAKAVEESAFSTASVQTTTGFAISDFSSDQWPSFSQSILLGLMVLGASAGSTGGAFKMIRMIVLVKYAYRQVLLAFNPQAVIPVKIGGKVLSEKLISKVLGFSVIYFGVVVVGTLILSTADLDFTSAISAVISAVGNVGPGFGLVGPAENYAFISAAGKITLVVCMLVGRLELLTVFALFAPTFWRWR